MKNKGFTVIELLVVLAVTAMLSTMTIIYSHVGQDQIALSIESSKIAQLILQAKQLSVATYSKNTATCAYGIHIDYSAQEYSLFAYNSREANGFCPSIASTTAIGAIDQSAIQQYGTASWQLHPAQGVSLFDDGGTTSTIHDILFYPPDPFTFVSLDGLTFQYNFPTSHIYLNTKNGDSSRTITVNSAGQVSL